MHINYFNAVQEPYLFELVYFSFDEEAAPFHESVGEKVAGDLALILRRSLKFVRRNKTIDISLQFAGFFYQYRNVMSKPRQFFYSIQMIYAEPTPTLLITSLHFVVACSPRLLNYVGQRGQLLAQTNSYLVRKRDFNLLCIVKKGSTMAQRFCVSDSPLHEIRQESLALDGH